MSGHTVVAVLGDDDMVEKLDAEHVLYEGETYTLTGLARELLGNRESHIAGPRYFKHNGKWLNSLREK